LGGAVSIAAGWVSAVVAARGARDKAGRSAGEVLITVLTAEAVKIGLIGLLLWLVLTTYDDVVAPALLGSFIITVLIFTMAFFVREYD
jgi:ATP synthase protein I